MQPAKGHTESSIRNWSLECQPLFFCVPSTEHISLCMKLFPSWMLCSFMQTWTDSLRFPFSKAVEAANQMRFGCFHTWTAIDFSFAVSVHSGNPGSYRHINHNIYLLMNWKLDYKPQTFYVSSNIPDIQLQDTGRGHHRQLMGRGWIFAHSKAGIFGIYVSGSFIKRHNLSWSCSRELFC